MSNKYIDFKNHFLISAALIGIHPAMVWANTCPTPPTSVEATISSTVSFDSKVNQYTYRYTVQNLKSSLLSIDRFLVLVPTQPSSMQPPNNNWDADFGTKPPRANWSTYLSDPSLPHSHQIDPNSKGPRPAFYAIKPGARLSGFSFQSPNPPGVTQYMIEGNTAIPSVTGTADNDEPLPNCPGWDFTGPKYQTMVSGITQGPSNPNVTSVVMRLRDADGDRPYGAFHPQDPKGKMSVLIPSSKAFDASTIDPSSIHFGPGLATPSSSKLVETRQEKFENEREEWEKFFDLFSIDKREDSKEKIQKKNLLMVFDVKSIGVRCVLDQALFLTGKTKDGKAITSGKSIRIEGCETKNSTLHGR
jgi:hypothetical protein